MTDSTTRTTGSCLRWIWLALLVVVLDLGTKYVADQVLSYGVPRPVLPVFDLTLLYNTGAAFSFLADAGGWQRWVFALIALLVSGMLIHWMHRTPARQWWLGIGLALVLGGAIGNLYDRIVQGYVIDFISLHYKGWYFPAFNLADTAITLGAVVLIVDMLFLSGLDKATD
ncbi:signal peptidase II [Marinobacterium arenosum]|uniref:signal peptidase II n=1 Tax=Marinobacterium arenosum TaxID=2862496 RepID=UPI001C985251|nr:signal peptidase II [Marinobacterium arenosum]MBY4678231.1 signal peptidase II [Marinobacterium arenosum]